MSQANQKTCFISAPFGFDAFPLMQALAEENIASSRLDISEPYEDIISAVKREIKKADFVCTILPSGYQLDNMILETGIALGINRPLLLLTDQDVSIPFDLQALRHVTTKLNEKRAIAGVLAEYLSDLTKGTRPRKPKHRRKLQTLSEDDVIGVSTILRHPHAVTELELVETLSDLFKKVGILHTVSPAANQRGAEGGADLALWIDETQSVLGNPILVEIKAGRLSQSKIDMTFHRVSNYLISTGLQFGLLVYLDTEGRTFKVPSTRLPLVICLSFAQLVDELRRGTFPSTLLDIRNKAAHGMAS